MKTGKRVLAAVRRDEVASGTMGVLKTLLGRRVPRDRVRVSLRRDGWLGVWCPCCASAWVVETRAFDVAGQFALDHAEAHRRAAATPGRLSTWPV